MATSLVVFSYVARAELVTESHTEAASAGSGFKDPGCIVIDAGHGGSNNGARVHGTPLSEKHLSLIVSRYVVRELRLLMPEACIELTRDSDSYVSLRQRSLFAIKKNAALFISLHFNASKNHDQSGYEVYVPDGAAISNAANRSRVQSGMDIDPSDSHVGDYYIIRHMIDPLVRDDVESLSKKLADHVHNGLARAMRSFPSRGIKKGDFDVLHSLGIPRVLAEIGFVDTPRGAALFSNKLELERISREIARSVASFFSVDVVSIGSEHNLRGDPNNRRDTHHVRKSNGPTRWSFSKRS